MSLKYADQVSSIPDCPASHYGGRDARAYRFVFHERMGESFLPPLAKSPQRALKMNTIERCGGWALSFFNSEEAAVAFYAKLQKVNPKVHKTIGDSVAGGQLFAADGLADLPDDRGHFDLHESSSAVLHDRFQTTQRLV